MSNLTPLPHVGNLISRHMEENRFPKAYLVTGLGSSQTVVGRLVTAPDLKVGQVWNMGQVLRKNFLADLAQQHPVAGASATDAALQQRIADLEKEVAIYKDLLKARLG